MARRRFHYDCLATTQEPRWLKVFDRCHCELTSRRLEPGVDLRAELRKAASQFATEGWIIEDQGAEHWVGNFFMNRAGDRWFVAILPSEKPSAGHSAALSGKPP
ncbi:MAG: hypothetical protein ABIP38_14760 [Steroidobacteraceae bacterium]